MGIRARDRSRGGPSIRKPGPLSIISEYHFIYRTKAWKRMIPSHRSQSIPFGLNTIPPTHAMAQSQPRHGYRPETTRAPVGCP
ncbi:hypothetical protein BN2364_3913 [Alloalcanivorax xenomutans]|nr:hypothetical protein BN2364_3913 [Alloalcanivorax xenomutans]